MNACTKMAKNGLPCSKEAGHSWGCKNDFCACGREARMSNRTICRLCRNEYQLNAYRYKLNDNPSFRFGLTTEEYQRLFSQQDGRCALCGDLLGKSRGHHTDHAHEENQKGLSRATSVRGLLCAFCNRSLGYIDVAVSKGWVQPTEKLANYLSRRPILEMRKLGVLSWPT